MFNKLHITIVAAVGFLLVALVAIAFALHMDPVGSVYDENMADFSGDWLDENGDEAVIFGITSPPDTEFVFQRSLKGSEFSNGNLCFISRNVIFSIYVDDELIYDFHPTLGGYYGKAYGDYIHMATFPPFSDERVLSIRGIVLTANEWTGFDDVVIQSSGAYISNIARENTPQFITFLLTFDFGAILFILGVIEHIRRVDMVETVYLGVITMLLSLWTNSSSRILQIITGNSAMLRLLDYTVLCLVTAPIVIFVASFTKNQKNIFVRIYVGIYMLNFLFQAMTIPAGLLDHHDMLPIDHSMIVLGALLVVYLVIKAIREKTIDHSQRTYLISSIAVIVCSGMIDMVRYYADRVTDTAYATRIGLLFFVGILTVYEFKQLITAQIKSRETEVMQRLAMEDTLTGLYNRTAFTYYEKELISQNEGKRLFIHLDVNYLKKVNDTYGHAEGDRHIIAAARVIRESFGAHGQCFRVGGDEFFVIMDGKDCQADYQGELAKFKEMQAEYNEKEKPPVPLSIAHGTAEYDCVDGNPEEAEKLADSRMYEDKKRIKAESFS